MDTYLIMGQIYPFAFNFTPKGCLPCDGRLLSINQNSALFSLLGTMYGGDGQTTFGLPDLRGRVLISSGQSSVGDYQLGEMAGTPTVALTQAEMPYHNHDADFHINEEEATSAVGTDKTLAGSAIYNSVPPDGILKAKSITVNPAGGNMPHSNMQPYLAINYCIAVYGIYPSKN